MIPESRVTAYQLPVTRAMLEPGSGMLCSKCLFSSLCWETMNMLCYMANETLQIELKLPELSQIPWVGPMKWHGPLNVEEEEAEYKKKKKMRQGMEILQSFKSWEDSACHGRCWRGNGEGMSRRASGLSADSEGTGTLILQPRGTEFCQQLEGTRKQIPPRDSRKPWNPTDTLTWAGRCPYQTSTEMWGNKCVLFCFKLIYLW